MRIRLIILIFLLSYLYASVSYALNAEEIIRLKQADVGEKLLLELERTDAIMQGVISVGEIIKLKEAGLSDEFIIKKIRVSSADINERSRHEMELREMEHRIQLAELALKEKERQIQQLRLHLKVISSYLLNFITNKEILKIVEKGKISGGDYKEIVKLLKELALGKESVDKKVEIKKDITLKSESSSSSGSIPMEIHIIKEVD